MSKLLGLIGPFFSVLKFLGVLALGRRLAKTEQTEVIVKEQQKNEEIALSNKRKSNTVILDELRSEYSRKDR